MSDPPRSARAAPAVARVDPEALVALEKLEAHVWSDAMRAAPADFASRLGLRVEPIADGVAIVASHYPNLLYNRVIAFGLDAPIDEAALDRAIALYAPGAPFAIQPAPFARPAAIADWLSARGIVSCFDWVIWARDAHAPLAVSAEIPIDRIGPDRAARWAALAAAIFTGEADLAPWLEAQVGRAGWSHYLAYHDDRPIGIGALFVEGALGWLGWGGTLREYRARGVQGAMIERRVRDAAAAGARWVRSETADDLPDRPNASFRNMARLGFELAYRRPSRAVRVDVPA